MTPGRTPARHPFYATLALPALLGSWARGALLLSSCPKIATTLNIMIERERRTDMLGSMKGLLETTWRRSEHSDLFQGE